MGERVDKMRCLCYAKFLSNGSVSHDEFFTHMDAKWVSIEDTSTASNQNMHSKLTQDNLFHKSIVFVIDCKTMEQISSAVATMPGAGLSDIEVFPVPEIECK